MEAHQREKRIGAGRAADPVLRKEETEPHRLRAEVLPYKFIGLTGIISLVEKEVHHRVHRIETRGKLIPRRDLEPDVVLADELTCPVKPLIYRLLVREEGVGDLLYAEPGESPERQGDLHLRGERGMAAREDHPQLAVGDLAVEKHLIHGRYRRVFRIQEEGNILGEFDVVPVLPNRIDRLV